MLIFIKDCFPGYKIYNINSIARISEVIKDKDDTYYYTVELTNDEIPLKSQSYNTKELAEMAQVATASKLNAFELLFERYKHVAEYFVSPIKFKDVDLEKKELKPVQLTINEILFYSIIL